MDSTYTLRQAADLLEVPAAQIRAFIDAGFLGNADRAGGALSFQDLVLLRTAKGLFERKVPRRRIQRALQRLKAQLPDGRPLTGVKLSADGDDLVVKEGSQRWNPESGQSLFDFEGPREGRRATFVPLRRKQSADGLHAEGSAMEETDPPSAIKAYRAALQADPDHAASHVNLGRLLHEQADLPSAEAHYRRALEINPADPTAAFNLAVAIEDQGRVTDAIAAYTEAIACPEPIADAFFNLARLYEQQGQKAAALRHLRDYRQRVRTGQS